ncbi:MAG: rhomboid family intramembrane serine protease [Planctomycetota bacterium]|nr:rhomboid family intramembrane serine protease [Planctomycetota bacterium]
MRTIDDRVGCRARCLRTMSQRRRVHGDGITFSIHRAYAVMLFLGLILLTWLFVGRFGRLEPYQTLVAAEPSTEGFLTHQLFHTRGLHLFLNMLVIFLAGGVLESYWGTQRFIIFGSVVALGVAVTTLIVGALVGSAGVFEGESPRAYGASGLALGCLACLAVAFPRGMICRGVSARQGTAAATFLGAAGLLFLDFSSRGSGDDALRGTFLVPQISGVGWALVYLWSEPWVQAYLEKRRVRREHHRERELYEIRQRVDQLLDKIKSGGLDSLTPGERSFLKDASRHYKNERPQA